MKKEQVVVHLIHTLYGGVSTVAANLMNEQYKNGLIPVIAYVYDDSKIESFMEFKAVKIKTHIPNVWGASMLLGMGINRIYAHVSKLYPNADVVIHAHNVQTVGLLSNIREIPIVCTLHSMHGKSSIRSVISDFVYKVILNKLNHHNKKIVSVSNAIKDYYDPKNKYEITVIHNGTKEGCPKQRHNNFTVGHVGDISYAKGFDVALEAFNLIDLSQTTSMKFIIAGKTKSISNEMLDRMISNSKNRDSIEWMGFIDNPLVNVFPKIDVFVLASKNEGLPMAIVEAFSMGIPVIATPVGGIPEIVKHGYNGFLVNTSKELAQAIVILKNDKVLYETMSINAKSTYEKGFSAQKMYHSYERCYVNQLSRVRV